MRTDSFSNKDFISLVDWSKEEIGTILDLASTLKEQFAFGDYHDHILRAKTLFMLFYNQSLRTRNSFEAGMTQLGGHAHFLEARSELWHVENPPNHRPDSRSGYESQSLDLGD